ncbi:hypothetical protein V8C86DRAFT_609551 [Haematococcus lacustris]
MQVSNMPLQHPCIRFVGRGEHVGSTHPAQPSPTPQPSIAHIRKQVYTCSSVIACVRLCCAAAAQHPLVLDHLVQTLRAMPLPWTPSPSGPCPCRHAVRAHSGQGADHRCADGAGAAREGRPAHGAAQQRWPEPGRLLGRPREVRLPRAPWLAHVPLGRTGFVYSCPPVCPPCCWSVNGTEMSAAGGRGAVARGNPDDPEQGAPSHPAPPGVTCTTRSRHR